MDNRELPKMNRNEKKGLKCLEKLNYKVTLRKKACGYYPKREINKKRKIIFLFATVSVLYSFDEFDFVTFARGYSFF